VRVGARQIRGITGHQGFDDVRGSLGDEKSEKSGEEATWEKIKQEKSKAMARKIKTPFQGPQNQQEKSKTLGLSNVGEGGVWGAPVEWC